MVLFILLYKVALTFQSVDSNPQFLKIKASDYYFPVVLFIILHIVLLTFESVDEILKCDHSNESY